MKRWTNFQRGVTSRAELIIKISQYWSVREKRDGKFLKIGPEWYGWLCEQRSRVFRWNVHAWAYPMAFAWHYRLIGVWGWHCQFANLVITSKWEYWGNGLEFRVPNSVIRENQKLIANSKLLVWNAIRDRNIPDVIDSKFSLNFNLASPRSEEHAEGGGGLIVKIAILAKWVSMNRFSRSLISNFLPILRFHHHHHPPPRRSIAKGGGGKFFKKFADFEFLVNFNFVPRKRHKEGGHFQRHHIDNMEILKH